MLRSPPSPPISPKERGGGDKGQKGTKTFFSTKRVLRCLDSENYKTNETIFAPPPPQGIGDRGAKRAKKFFFV